MKNSLFSYIMIFMNALKPNGEFVTINGHKIHVYRTGAGYA